jgi:hypothetical protein
LAREVIEEVGTVEEVTDGHGRVKITKGKVGCRICNSSAIDMSGLSQLQVFFSTASLGPCNTRWVRLLWAGQGLPSHSMTSAFGAHDRVRVRCIPQPTDSMNTCMYAVSIERADRVYDTKLVFLNQLLTADSVAGAQSNTMYKV